MKGADMGWIWRLFLLSLVVLTGVPVPAVSQPETEEPHGRLGCEKCHRNEQNKPPAALRPDDSSETLCRQCHPKVSRLHYRGLNPFLDTAARGKQFSRAASKRPFLFCLDCHAIHDSAEKKFLLSGIYMERAGRSRSINPHWKEYLCLCCHETTPARNTPRLKEKGDHNLLCNRCHGTRHARSDIHPVNVKPSSMVQIPKDMPLQNGSLSCSTCHDVRLQMGAPASKMLRKRNPDFLRRENLSRNSFCFLCHLREAYQRMNPHIQLDEQGNIIQGTCLFCHTTRPDVTIMGLRHVRFITRNPDEYCIGCHHGYTRAHPAGVDHLRRPSRKILRAIQTSVKRLGVELPLYRGRIICATCHNPHQEGVLKIRASAAGAERPNKLRLMPGNMQCIGCHWNKK
ncbi:hypothetical protein [Desulfolithobacter sp.]